MYRMIQLQDMVKGMKRSTESLWRKELRKQRKIYDLSLRNSKYYETKEHWEQGLLNED